MGINAGMKVMRLIIDEQRWVGGLGVQCGCRCGGGKDKSTHIPTHPEDLKIGAFLKSTLNY